MTQMTRILGLLCLLGLLGRVSSQPCSLNSDCTATPNACYDGVCLSSTCQYNVAFGRVCSFGAIVGNGVCGISGTCVECNSLSDCPTRACYTASCSSNICNYGTASQYTQCGPGNAGWCSSGVCQDIVTNLNGYTRTTYASSGSSTYSNSASACPNWSGTNTLTATSGSTYVIGMLCKWTLPAGTTGTFTSCAIESLTWDYVWYYTNLWPVGDGSGPSPRYSSLPIPTVNGPANMYFRSDPGCCLTTGFNFVVSPKACTTPTVQVDCPPLACQVNTCNGGVCSYTPMANGLACGLGRSGTCSAGYCQNEADANICTINADCPVRTCRISTCWSSGLCYYADSGPGASCGPFAVCDGSGNCVSSAPPCSLSSDCPDQLCYTKTCVGNQCSYAVAPANTPCGVAGYCAGTTATCLGEAPDAFSRVAISGACGDWNGVNLIASTSDGTYAANMNCRWSFPSGYVTSVVSLQLEGTAADYIYFNWQSSVRYAALPVPQIGGPGWIHFQTNANAPFQSGFQITLIAGCNNSADCPAQECRIPGCSASLCTSNPGPDGVACGRGLTGSCSNGACVGEVLTVCSVPSDCPTRTCQVPSCSATVCFYGNAAAGTLCGTFGSCNSTGSCIPHPCAISTDCPNAECLVASCPSGACIYSAASPGAPCGSGLSGYCSSGTCTSIATSLSVVGVGCPAWSGTTLTVNGYSNNLFCQWSFPSIYKATFTTLNLGISGGGDYVYYNHDSSLANRYYFLPIPDKDGPAWISFRSDASLVYTGFSVSLSPRFVCNVTADCPFQECETASCTPGLVCSYVIQQSGARCGVALTGQCFSGTCTPDNVPPQMTCSADIYSNQNIVTYPDAVGTDFNPPVLVVRTTGPASGSSYPLGSTTIQFSGTDVANNSASCQFNVVVDQTPPTITCPSNRLSNVAVQNFGNAVVSDSSPYTVAVTAGLPSGSTFPEGINSVTFTATDAAGNSNQCTFNLTIDLTPPAMVCNPGISQTDPVVFFYGANATDANGPITITQISGLTSGSTFPNGSTTVTYRGVDAAANQALCSFTVRINQPPILNCPSDFMTNNLLVTYAQPTSPDTGLIIQRTSGGASGTLFPEGNNFVSFLATDSIGLTATCSFFVNVDVTGPVMTCPANFLVKYANVNLALTPPSATDANPPVVIVQTAGPTTGMLFPEGPNTITYTGTDQASNPSSCSFLVTVDLTPPAITCPADISTTNANVVVPLATGTDVNGPVAITSSVSLTQPFLDGPTQIVWTATDTAGNSASCKMYVTVDPCGGPCNSPPSNCFMPAGTCKNAACVYTPFSDYTACSADGSLVCINKVCQTRPPEPKKKETKTANGANSLSPSLLIIFSILAGIFARRAV